MTVVSFSLEAMDTTNTTGWWMCTGCGVEAELPVTATAGCEVPCPDCGEAMSESWRWDVLAA
jgi:predicted RNA-binding Zn-ribbon protein involved in translation (DUF1610 family)